jgi:hypothetical protein
MFPALEMLRMNGLPQAMQAFASRLVCLVCHAVAAL